MKMWSVFLLWFVLLSGSASGELLLQYVYSSSMVPRPPGYYPLGFGVGASTAVFGTARTPESVGQSVFADQETVDDFNTVFGRGVQEVDIIHFGAGGNQAGIPNEQGTQAGPSPAFQLIERLVPRLGDGLIGYHLTGIEHVLDSYSEEPNIGQLGTVRVRAQQTIKFHGDPIPPLNGDFNRNGEVDAADYVLWRNAYDTIGSLPNESGLTPTIVGDEDGMYWKSHFGGTAFAPPTGLASGSIPESDTFVLIILSTIIVFSQIRIYRREFGCTS